jgi:hypothetical protein
MTQPHRAVTQIEREALNHALSALRRYEPVGAHSYNEQRYEKLRTAALEQLTLLLQAASEACANGVGLLWAATDEPGNPARTTTLERLIFEAVTRRIAAFIEVTWAQGSELLTEPERNDQLRQEKPRLEVDIEDAPERAKPSELRHLVTIDDVDDDASSAIIEILTAHPDADMDELSALLSARDGEVWTPRRLLQAVADLRSRSDARGVLATSAVIERVRGMADIRAQWSALGLSSLSEQHWALLESCASAAPNNARDVAQHFERLTGVLLTSEEVMAGATFIRTRVIVPMAAAAGRGELSEDGEALVNEVASMLPDHEKWESDDDFRARALFEVMSAALNAPPRVERAEEPGSVALVAAACAGLPAARACAFSVECDPTFTPPAIDPARSDPNATYRRRFSDVLARQPRLAPYFATGRGERRRRSDARTS